MNKDKLHIYTIIYSYWFNSDPSNIFLDEKKIECKNEDFIKTLMYFEFDLRQDVGNNYRIEDIINLAFQLELEENEN